MLKKATRATKDAKPFFTKKDFFLDFFSSFFSSCFFSPKKIKLKFEIFSSSFFFKKKKKKKKEKRKRFWKKSFGVCERENARFRDAHNNTHARAETHDETREEAKSDDHRDHHDDDDVVVVVVVPK